MRLLIPLTGILLTYEPRGDLKDSVRPIELPILSGLNMWAVGYDFDRGVVEVEAEVCRVRMARLTDGSVKIIRELMDAEAEQVIETFMEDDEGYKVRSSETLAAVQNLLEKPLDQLYVMSGCHRLRKPRVEG